MVDLVGFRVSVALTDNIAFYASVGGAPEAYGSRRVCLCVSE